MSSRRSHLGYRGSVAVSFFGFLCHWFIHGTGVKICVGQGYEPHFTDAKVPSESGDEALLSFISLLRTFFTKLNSVEITSC